MHTTPVTRTQVAAAARQSTTVDVSTAALKAATGGRGRSDRHRRAQRRRRRRPRPPAAEQSTSGPDPLYAVDGRTIGSAGDSAPARLPAGSPRTPVRRSRSAEREPHCRAGEAAAVGESEAFGRRRGMRSPSAEASPRWPGFKNASRRSPSTSSSVRRDCLARWRNELERLGSPACHPCGAHAAPRHRCWPAAFAAHERSRPNGLSTSLH